MEGALPWSHPALAWKLVEVGLCAQLSESVLEVFVNLRDVNVGELASQALTTVMCCSICSASRALIVSAISSLTWRNTS